MRGRLALLAGLLGCAACAACRGGSGGADAGGAASASAAPSASAPPPASAGPEGRGGDDVGPVYPLTRDPPDPRAEALCRALHEAPARRRAECCGEAAGPPPPTLGECARMLSYALRSGALTLAPEDAARCEEAIAGAHEGCDWVGPGAPPVPAACLGILHGTLGEGARCRSSLECRGDMRCHGLGPTEAGTCGPPRRAGAGCGSGVDPLAGYARQIDADAAHPPCTGYCALRRCADPVPAGGACVSSAACGPGALCTAGKCVPGAPPPAGEPCPAGACAGGARCVKGRCVAPRPEGEPCEADAECRAACVRPEGRAKGACGKRCNRSGFPR
ncbi:MAG: hypothetical protein IT372_41470 [Polyangiaceae bacterium]|nr:hypothetical protein [Polyangiaceae bacterium]